MFKRTNILAAIFTALCFATPVISQDVTADTVVKTVNGKDITLGHMIVLRDALPEQYTSLADDVLFEGILEQLVQQAVLAQEAGDPSRTIQLQLENERRSLLAGEALQALLTSAVTEETIQAAYEARFADAEPTQEYNASHILVETEDEAKVLVNELNGGADFAELAMAKSTGPSGPNGGELGWFSTGMMVKPFEDTVITMEAGRISAPVQTQFGWHVIKLNETRVQAAPPIGEIRGELIEEIQKAAIDQHLAGLIQDADIVSPDLSTLDPASINDLGILEN